jgi:hypothetical protein
MARKKKELTKWEIAKAILKTEILAGRLPPDMPAREVYPLRPEYGQVVYTNFVNNLRNLRNSLNALGNRASIDDLALARDRRLHPIEMENPPNFPYPRWDGSEAQLLLELDIDEERHLQMPPKRLRETKLAYQAFPLDIFRKHINQEVRSRTESSYWLARKRAKAANTNVVAAPPLELRYCSTPLRY